MLYHAAALKKPRLLDIALYHGGVQSALPHALQVGGKLVEPSLTAEHVYAAVVVEEMRPNEVMEYVQMR